MNLLSDPALWLANHLSFYLRCYLELVSRKPRLNLIINCVKNRCRIGPFLGLMSRSVRLKDGLFPLDRILPLYVLRLQHE